MVANASDNDIFMFQLFCGLVNDFFINVQNMHTKAVGFADLHFKNWLTFSSEIQIQE